MMRRIIIIRYNEISLKGKNRGFFEARLVKNLQHRLQGMAAQVVRRYGRIIIFCENETYIENIISICQKTFGVENFSTGHAVPLTTDIQEITNIAINNLRGQTWKSFGVHVRRSNKAYPVRSMDLSAQIGASCLDAFPDKQVDLKNPDQAVTIEIGSKEIFISGNKISGPGGLPTGTSGRVLCLLSGGIDSPVAAWQLMRRGCKVDFVHMHSAPYASRASIEKVEELAQELAQWQGKTQLFLLPFIDIQKYITLHADSSYGVILYRRHMIRLAERIAKRAKAKALITGESVGQVASQTIENIASVDRVATFPILRPLIGMNKSDIMTMAKSIGTYETSILPHDDCCSLFVPKHPKTKTDIEDVEEQESKLPDIEPLLTDALQRTKRIVLK